MPCSSFISNSELLRAHRIITHDLTGSFMRTPLCDAYRRFDVLDLKDSTNHSILEREISWEFFKDYELINRRDFGKVAKLGNIRIKNSDKSKGLGKDIHSQHLDVFRTNNIRQIHLSAKWDGVIVWPTLFFKFCFPDQEDELLEHISVYMLDILGYSSIKVETIMSSYSDIRNLGIHLKPNSKVWFTEWYQQTNRSLQYDMYKDVS